MKNRSLFILLPAIFLFSGCGPLLLSEQVQGRFTNGIYATAEDRAFHEKAMKDRRLAELQKQTDASAININDYGNTENSYYLADGESYEERLRKFDSPVYIYNIELNDLWYDSYWYRPAWYWGTGWYNPYWGGFYSSFWFGGPYWHWYDVPGWSWYWDWHWPSPWYHYGYWPHHHHSTRDIYYGRRDSGPSYGNRVYNTTHKSGSFYRRYGSAEGRYNGYSSHSIGGAKSGSTYRRTRATSTYSNNSSGTREYHNNSGNQSRSSGTSYSRNRSSRNSSYNSSSPATRSSGSSYSTGRSSGSGYSGGASRSGGSSYRRR